MTVDEPKSNEPSIKNMNNPNRNQSSNSTNPPSSDTSPNAPNALNPPSSSPHLQDRPCVLITNLGSPENPSPPAVRKYLREFLSDRRVIETHPLLWKPVLECIILRVRPKASCEKYGMIWTENGSPLVHYTRVQAKYLNEKLCGVADVRWAMRYGKPAIVDVLSEIYAAGYRKLLVVPLYPQYSQVVGGTAMDKVFSWSMKSRDQFELRSVRSFQEHPAYIDAVVNAIETKWQEVGRPNFAAGDKLLLSYHGITKAMSDGGDPYDSECKASTAAICQRLGIEMDKEGLHTYQSVFGPAEWLKPATIDTVAALGKQGTKRVDVVCPGFVSDCLETLEEIEMQNREAFTTAGGQEFHYIPWGNDQEKWLSGLETIVREALVGW